MYEIGPYLRAALKQKGMTQKELASELGMTKEHISTICLNKRRPSLDALEKICSVLGMSFSEFFADKSNDYALTLSADEYKMLSDYRCLQPHERRVFADAMRSLHKTRPATASDEAVSSYRFVDGVAAAGSPLFDASRDDAVSVPPKYLDRERFSIIEANGHSMEPEIMDGDFVVVANSVSPEQGEIALVQLDSTDSDGEYTIKRLYRHADRIELRSINPDFAPMLYPFSDLLSARKVVHVIHTSAR